jgi:hypothetical protein
MTEPKATLYTPKWNEARQRVQQVDSASCALFVTLLDHIERGWQVLRPLQVWFEQHQTNAAADDDYAHVLTFCEGSTDVFLQVGGGVADLVPGWSHWAEEADPSDVDGWAEAFLRDLKILRLACEGGMVPKQFRELVASAAAEMDGGWCRLLSALLGAVGELIPTDTAGEGAPGSEAVDVLVWGLPVDQQSVGERVLLDKLAEVYRAAGVEPPAWMGGGGDGTAPAQSVQ